MSDLMAHHNMFLKQLISYCRHVYPFLFRKSEGGWPDFHKVKDYAEFIGQEASDIIKSKLEGPDPCLISRFGAVELNTLINYILIKRAKLKPFRSVIKYINKEYPYSYWWDSSIYHTLRNNAGFFPIIDEQIEKFCELYLDNLKHIDILGSWIDREDFVKKYYSPAIIQIRISDIEPYFHTSPWSFALKGRKVLVIYPFEDSIRNQYAIRSLLFKNPDVLPDFELITYKPIQTNGLCDESLKYKTWFEALNTMKNDISKIDFEIAIIGAGAYGLPLGVFIKEMGKKALHMGGATQLLFGIRGRRWDELDWYRDNLFNANWVHPLPQETPGYYKNIENGCYW